MTKPKAPKDDRVPTSRQDLIDYVSASTGVTKKDVKEVLDAAFQGIVQLATDSPHLTIREFGRFEMRHRAAKCNRSSLSGVPVIIPAREALSFTAAPGLVKEVDY